MDWFNMGFVAAIVAVSTGGWLMNNWIRAKHGYPLENEWGGTTDRPETKEARKLHAENSELRAELIKVDKRMQVLERIVTDTGYVVAEQIEALRDPRRVGNDDAGVALGTPLKERV